MVSPRWNSIAFSVLLGVVPGSAAFAQDETPAASRPVKTGQDFAPPEEFIDVNGISTHFVARGDRGPVVVLIHGFGSNTYTWRKQLDGLSDRFRVIAVDLKGFGLTAKPRDGQYHLAAYTSHLLAFLDALHLERPVLVGNSMGGAVALQLALRHPDRVAGLVLVDSAMPDFRPPRIDRGEPIAADDAKDGEPAAENDDRAHSPDARTPAKAAGIQLRPNPILLRLLITRSMIERGLKASFRDPGIVTPEMVDAYYNPTTIDGAMEALAAMMTPPAEAIGEAEPLPPLESLRIPTLIVWGRDDRVIPVALADAFARRIPGARQMIFEECGHLPHEERPDLFDAALTEFVSGIRPVAVSSPAPRIEVSPPARNSQP